MVEAERNCCLYVASERGTVDDAEPSLLALKEERD